MATNYTGNPGATQAPGPAPALGAAPIASLPADGDTLNVSSIAQAFKECLDFIAFLSGVLKRGIPDWNAATTYAINDIVQYIGDGRTYRCIQAGINHLPSDAAYWERWGYSKSDLTWADASAGVAMSSGAASSAWRKNDEVIKTVVLALNGIDSDQGGMGAATITLSGVAAMPTGIIAVQVTPGPTSASEYIANVQAHITGSQVFTVSLMPNAAHDAQTFSAFVTIWGI